MKKRQYCFGGVEIEVTMPEERFYTNEYRLAPFRTDSLKSPHVMKFHWVKKLSPPQGMLISNRSSRHIYNNGAEFICYLTGGCSDWKQAPVRISRKGKFYEIQVLQSSFPERIALKTVLECMNAEHLLSEANSFLLHSSYIAVNGKAILFTAPSGTGKSTQAELWKQFRDAEIINGDRAVVRWKINETENIILAEGLPFAGSSEYCLNRSLPLQAIVRLEQASVTSIRRIRGYEAFSNLLKECTMNPWDRNEMKRLTEVATHVAEMVPMFHLACTPDKSAVTALEKALFDCAVTDIRQNGEGNE